MFLSRTGPSWRGGILLGSLQDCSSLFPEKVNLRSLNMYRYVSLISHLVAGAVMFKRLSFLGSN